MALKVDEIYYGLESPADGGARLAASWPAHPDLPCYRPPRMTSGIRRDEVRDQLRRYCQTAPESGFRRWSHSLAQLGDLGDPC